MGGGEGDDGGKGVLSSSPASSSNAGACESESNKGDKTEPIARGEVGMKWEVGTEETKPDCC